MTNTYNIDTAVAAIDRQLEILEDSISETTVKINQLRNAKELLMGTSDGTLASTFSSANTSTSTRRVVKKREMSDEARKKISERMAQRWAEKRGDGVIPVTPAEEQTVQAEAAPVEEIPTSPVEEFNELMSDVSTGKGRRGKVSAGHN